MGAPGNLFEFELKMQREMSAMHVELAMQTPIDNHEGPERQAASAFVADRLCPGCSRPLVGRRMSRPVLSDEPSLDHWLHHCECGELTLYKPDGSARRVYDLHRPPEAPRPDLTAPCELLVQPLLRLVTMAHVSSCNPSLSRGKPRRGSSQRVDLANDRRGDARRTHANFSRFS